MKIDKLIASEGRCGQFPLGTVRTERGIHISIVSEEDAVSLILYETADGEEKSRVIAFPDTGRLGHVWAMELQGQDFQGIRYGILEQGKERPDDYGRMFSGRELWGRPEEGERQVRSQFAFRDFDWGEDRAPQIPYEEGIFYRIHVRNLTMGLEQGGTFAAIEGRIPYLKELGITTLELMIPNEFDELPQPDPGSKSPYDSGSPERRKNCWGYGPGFLFAPKASYAADPQDPVTEFKHLVRELHRNGLELVIELFFTGQESPSFVQEAVRFWVKEYHVDGIHLAGFPRTEALPDDPYLAKTKLLANGWGEEASPLRHLAEYNDGFLVDMRRFLKGDEDQINSLIYRTRRNPKGYGVINYMAHTNGFTLLDAVSYERKHNEDNGENNQDGTSWNYTWNCGVEGPTKKKKILEMRKKQLRNAFLLLLLSQGTPLILAGDEFGNSQNGNNNSYCQDNEISWLDWSLPETNRDIYDFVRYAIRFRKAHPVFHMETEPKVLDYKSCGCPDVSYHGVKAWCPEFDNFRRQLGIMYCGEYGAKQDGTPDDYFFVAYNMHWEPHEFALPRLPKGMKWHLSFHTDMKDRNGIYRPGEESALDHQKQFVVPARTIVVFIGLRTQPGEEKSGIKKEDRKKNDRKKSDRKKETKKKQEVSGRLGPGSGDPAGLLS